MKLVGVISTAVLSLTLGVAAPAYAQQEQHEQHDQQVQDKDKAAQQDEKKTEPEKSVKPEERNAQQQDKNAKQEERTAQQQDRNAKQEEGTAQQQDRTAKQEGKTAEDQRGAADHGRIPDDRFRANFGREHVFVINRPVIVEGHPRFQYGGYWFGYSEPWPVGWFYTDDVYVDYTDGGYYLYNRVHPGVRISINIF